MAPNGLFSVFPFNSVSIHNQLFCSLFVKTFSFFCTPLSKLSTITPLSLQKQAAKAAILAQDLQHLSAQTAEDVLQISPYTNVFKYWTCAFLLDEGGSHINGFADVSVRTSAASLILNNETMEHFQARAELERCAAVCLKTR